MGAAPPLQVFVSYSHHDTGWRERLFGDFVLTTAGDCLIWSDASIRAGDSWADEIERRLQGCAVAVLLTSPNFLKSQFIRERELPCILQRARAGGLRVLWFPIGLDRGAVEQHCPELAALQAAAPLDTALPGDAEAAPGTAVQGARLRLREQLQAALDPLGAELARVLSGRYELVERMREGSRATVYRATDRLLGRSVAIKVLKDRELGRRRDFMADVQRAVRLSEEPNFINLYDCGPPDSLAFCVQQLVEGPTLREKLDAAGGRLLPIAGLWRTFCGLARAIARAHAAGITYGNLKPGNIVLDDEGEPFILPVGRRRDAPHDERRLAALQQRAVAAAEGGPPLCTADADDLAYLVPDQFGDGVQPIDPALVDQYMLGLLGWEMVVGRRPAAVARPQTLLEAGRRAFADLPPVSRYRPLVPRRIEAMLARMTARLPRDRFDSLDAVVRELAAMRDIGLLIVNDSWRRVAGEADFESDFARRFYRLFLRLAPEAEAHFGHFDDARWAQQHRMVRDAVLLLLAFSQQRGDASEPNVLSRIAAGHREIPAWLYGPFGDALVGTVCGRPEDDVPPADPLCRGERERDALESHWHDALAPGLQWLRARARG